MISSSTAEIPASNLLSARVGIILPIKLATNSGSNQNRSLTAVSVQPPSGAYPSFSRISPISSNSLDVNSAAQSFAPDQNSKSDKLIS